MKTKNYIGDGVYAETDDHTLDLVLTTSDGISVTNRIVLEPEVWNSLVAVVQDFQKHLRRFVMPSTLSDQMSFDHTLDIVLTTSDWISVTNRIVLEPEVWNSLVAVVQDFQKHLRRFA